MFGPYILHVVGCLDRDQRRCLFGRESPTLDRLKGSSSFALCNTNISKTIQDLGKKSKRFEPSCHVKGPNGVREVGR